MIESRNIERTLNIQHPKLPMSPGPHPDPLPPDGRGRNCSSVGKKLGPSATYLAAPGDGRCPAHWAKLTLLPRIVAAPRLKLEF